MKYNLLCDPCIRVRLISGDFVLLTLPGVLSALSCNEINSFVALRPHQAHPWHAFLCQVTAMALDLYSPKNLPSINGISPHLLLGERSEEEWRIILSMLTSDFPNDEPWTMFVEDLSRPAFLQPPVPEGEVDTWKDQIFPDNLDVLVQSKNLGIKTGKAVNPNIDDWIFALLSLQTQSAFLGVGNYGVARQNGGFATRAGVGLCTSLHWGGQWGRDTRILLESLLEAEEKYTLEWNLDEGVRLVWTVPWSGNESLSIRQLHPLFIESARRIRLQRNEKKVWAKYIGTESSRIEAKDLKGNIEDPWIPIDMKTKGALNKRPDYEVMRNVLFDRATFSPCLLQELHACDEGHDFFIRFRFLSRKKGSTEEYLERVVFVPRKMRLPFKSKTELNIVSQTMIALVKNMENKVLWPAIVSLYRSSQEKGGSNGKAEASQAVRSLDTFVDSRFFELTWECLAIYYESSTSPKTYLAPWSEFLLLEAKKLFEMAIQNVSLSGPRRYRAISCAESVFYGGINKHFIV